MISTVFLTVALSQVAAPETSLRVAAGAQIGAPHVFGAVARASLLYAHKTRFEADLQWEPSAYLQSYSLGAAWRPLDSIVYVGPRFRLLQYQAPWARGYSLADNFFGLGLEAGVRIGVGPEQRGTITIGLQATYIPAQATTLQLMFGLSVGFTWAFFEQAM